MEIARLVLEYCKVAAWPAVVTIVLVAYRQRLAAMLPRLSGVSAGSFSATFDSSVAQATALTNADGLTTPPADVVGLTPTSYAEARELGDSLRAGSPVLLDLNQLAEADAKRLVDFATGVVYATSGTIKRVRSRLFLVTTGPQDSKPEPAPTG